MPSLLCQCLSVVLALSYVSLSHGACNALNPDLLELDVAYSDLTEANFTVIPPATVVGGDILIVAPDEDDGTGGIAGSFWHTANRRIADGFHATFEWAYEGNSDGVAFIVQNDKTSDIEGAVGPGLGYLNGLDRYLAVGLDICPQLTRSKRYPCVANSSVLVSVTAQAVFPASVLTFGEALHPRTLFPSSETITIHVFYLAFENKILVFTGSNADIPLIEVNMTGFTNIQEHFGSRFGTFGFSSSNGNKAVDAGSIKVKGFSLRKFISEIRLSEELLVSLPIAVGLGKQVRIDIVVVDECNMASSSKAAQLNITIESVLAHLEAFTLDGLSRIEPISTFETGGTFSLVFLMPPNVATDWTLHASVQTPSGLVNVQGAPLQGAVRTVNPPPAGLPQWVVILLASVMAVFTLIIIMSLARLYRYRKKLKESAELIGYGKEKAKIDELDRAVKYTMSPLMGTLEELEAKLAANKVRLEALKKGDYVKDISGTVAQMKKGNAALRKELSRLKIKEQRLEERLNQGRHKHKNPYEGMEVPLKKEISQTEDFD